MGKVTGAYAHASEEGLRAQLKGPKDRNSAQKILVVMYATVDPRPAEEIALHIGVSRKAFAL
jgi:hypothetical protein